MFSTIIISLTKEILCNCCIITALRLLDIIFNSIVKYLILFHSSIFLEKLYYILSTLNIKNRSDQEMTTFKQDFAKKINNIPKDILFHMAIQYCLICLLPLVTGFRRNGNLIVINEFQTAWGNDQHKTFTMQAW